MGKIIAVANQKGGVGKTTTAVSMAACAAQNGYRVLLVDFDPQGNASSGVGVACKKQTVYEALLSQCTMEAVTEKTQVENLFCAPSDIRLAGAELELAQMDKREFRLRGALALVRDQYDFLFIDCPPSLGLITINALVSADSVLIPVQCEYYALEGISALMDTIKRIKSGLNASLEVEGVVMTMFDGRTNLSLQVVAQVKKYFRGKMFATPIPRNVRLGEAPSHGEPITLYDPRSTGAQAYQAVTKEFLKNNKK